MMKMNKITFSHPDVIETEAPEENEDVLTSEIETKETYNT
jgi:hypothetical protein